MAFASGARFELGEKTKAALTAGGLKPLTGTPRALDPVPPLPRVAAIAAGAQNGPRAGAIRLRGRTPVRGLYPRPDTVALADSTVLSFAPTDTAVSYRVEVEDESGKTAFEAQTQSPNLVLSPGILASGARYYWKVRTIERIGPAQRGESEFQTLGREDALRRAALRANLETRRDAASLALLAEIDHRLGLLREARDGFRAALAIAPGDDALQLALEQVEKELAAGGDGVHGCLTAGRAKRVALHAVPLDFIGGRFAHSLHCPAFQLIGDGP